MTKSIAVVAALVTVMAVAPSTAEARWWEPGKCLPIPGNMKPYTKADNQAKGLATSKVPCWIAAYSFDAWLLRPGRPDANDDGRRFQLRTGGASWFVDLACRYQLLGDGRTWRISCEVKRGLGPRIRGPKDDPPFPTLNMSGGTIRWKW
jgi:hypothetical protein